MTRTERAAYPRAVNRDRSESRTGLDNSLRKGGAGGHNWGSLNDEQYLESSAIDDEVEGESVPRTTSKAESPDRSPKSSTEDKSSVSSNSPSEEDIERAKQLRKNAFKKGDQLDLAAIARTSAGASTSPP
ncbi:hypothetical protein AGABI1DRAFT_114630 [Agaricus bisporus var. burnettii JB137-S8]|uniref:Hyaluronan/mRNA-binding protein domain-containing protein n=2 Tax=Agaricus bisporus var. burnettii TaxID=192524 RepID=K5WSD3_AGABU|nr:hypothetical protein AGABI2DRAFT_194814 [Agaricus bisporus var. bisporus H97]XP_007331003.1 uncharacterized protein AGABI1DRAFT_114630 [Agaricus bisporus var. burnettii JB137-S8]EKM78326.1 hypothetical protein AGABI1DRAFT_114630 [Agaricus bisporus var. burnettii JB137-S8]EKV43894.1 hypothetical protein AGABI2DRAFT_194814 [Agaricus bisporus var. bisporus H97]KAF7762117.1 hypothetical protein Agabi119p4_8710 [Agaricus bisporus var. burnettii]